MKKSICLILFITLLLFSCDKDKRASKRFMNAGTWLVKSFTVDGETLPGTNSFWIISRCDIYETTCTGNWRLEDATSGFYWQFNEKAQVFTLARIVAPEDCEDFYTKPIEQLTYNLSGTYKVVETKRRRKVFESRETIGYEGKTIRLELERYEING